MDIAVPKPTLHRFLQLETRWDDLLLRRSALSEQESSQKNEELQKRLRANLGPGPLDGAGWTWTWVVDEKTKASAFTEEEFEAWLAPSKDMAAVEQEIDVVEAEIKGLFAQLPFDGEFFIEKRYLREKSSGDAVDFSNFRSQIVALLLESDPIAGQQEPTGLEKHWPLPATRPPSRQRQRAQAYDLLLKRFDLQGPLRSMSMREITDEANGQRSADDKRRHPGGAVSEATVTRLLREASGE